MSITPERKQELIETWTETTRRYVELFESLTGEQIIETSGSIEDRITTNLTDAGVLQP